MRAAIGLPVAEVPTPWAESATAHLARAERLWDEYRSDSRIGLYFAPLTVRGLSEALLLRVRRVADELDARVAVHLAELAGPAESADAAELAALAGAGVQDSARAPRPDRPLRQLHALGLLRPGFTAIGAGVCDGADLELLARHGASLIACPQADLRLGARSPVASLEGNRTGLGTDSPVAAGALDLLAEARAGALHSGLAAGEVLRMATLGGATVLGLQAQIGSIEPGKAADLICIDLRALSGPPGAAIADAIAFGAPPAPGSEAWAAR